MPYLILVEGPTDAEFFRALLKQRGIINLYNVRCPKELSGVNGNGHTRFREALNGFTINQGYEDILAILIVTDSDEKPDESFVLIQNQIRDTERNHVAPDRPLEKSSGSPAIAILTLPWIDEPGNLETLCLRAAESAAANSSSIGCINAFQSCIGANAWPLGKRSKIRIRLITIAGYQRNCDLSVAHFWKKCPDLVPLSDQCFDKISEFLRLFPTLACS